MKSDQQRAATMAAAVLPRNISGKNIKKITPSNNYNYNYNYTLVTSSSSSSSQFILDPSDLEFSDRSLQITSGSTSPGAVPFKRLNKTRSGGGAAVVSNLLKSLLSIISFPTIFPTCRWLNIPSMMTTSTTQLSLIKTPSLGRKVTGTLFGHRRGHVSFAVQDEYSRSELPVFLIELAVSTSTLVKEMSSGLVRIALECEKKCSHASTRANGGKNNNNKLFSEPTWTMYCNGRKCGYAPTRACNESDWHVLSTIRSVSVGAGVIPLVAEDGGGKAGGSSELGELLYMRARFERVVGSRDSEAFYMMNPDGNGGPELSIFLLRI